MSGRVIAIGGPTASGKTSLAIEVAQRVGGEIVSCDSMQVYRLLDVGTAKPTAEERAAVPHHLIDFLPPEQRYSVAEYVRDARAVIADIQSRGRVPVICGGTGLYMRSLLQGIDFDAAASVDEALREQLKAVYREQGPQVLLDEIAAVDSAYAQKLAPADEKRIVRAVELIRTTGSTVPQQNARSRVYEPLSCNGYFLDFSNRALLYERIHARIDAMLQQGLLQEAKLVYDHRDTYTTAAAAIGYKELFGYFEQQLPLEQCVEKLKQATRNYAKRQLTWFRREEGFAVLDGAMADTRALADTVVKVWFEGNAT